ncbi:MAG TPA: ATP-binding cassette domain-containing protein [Acetobacteraceae bacterium]|nr:ATP-binding cassette domain-containing protein [Acetobacteraceae bacterium]
MHEPAARDPPESRRPAITARGVRKHYGHVEALRGASLTVGLGEIVALVGDNGAGKSTMMKVMCGAVAPDAGEVVLGDGTRVEAGRFNAADRGVGVVYQDLALAPHLSVLENIYLGHERLQPRRPRWLGLLDRRAMAGEAEAALRRLGIALPTVEVPVNLLSGGQRQAVAIARAVTWARSVVLLDEPTASLGTRQSDIVVNLIRAIARQGLGVMLISHDMERLMRVADRIVVMRRGAVAAELPGATTTLSQIVEAMLGGTPHLPGGSAAPAA